MFDKKNIELDEKQSTRRRKEYLLMDETGAIQLVMSVYRNPDIEALTFTFQQANSYGLIPVIDVLPDRVELTLEYCDIMPPIYPKDLERFIHDTTFSKEAGEYILAHIDEL